MNVRALASLIVIALFIYVPTALSGSRIFLDPRSMAMGGAGVASATKFNASHHNPALIAFNRGERPDKVYMSANLGARELYDHEFEDALADYQFNDHEIERNFLERFEFGAGSGEGDSDEGLTPDEQEQRRRNRVAAAEALREKILGLNLKSYRKDETKGFSILADTRPITINVYHREDVREMYVIRYTDEALIQQAIDIANEVPDTPPFGPDLEDQLTSSVDATYFKMRELGVTVASTEVIAYNMPVSWGFTPKWIQINGAHERTRLREFDPAIPPELIASEDLLEWNFDVGFALLLTNDFLINGLGIDGWATEGEWVFGFSGINLFPTDFTPYVPTRRDVFCNCITLGDEFQYPAVKRAINPIYRMGMAHYREDYMLTLDFDLVENEVFDFEGLTRFVSVGGEYFLRDDFHLRAGVRVNVAQTDAGAREKTVLTGGFIYQPNHFAIEGAFMINDIEMGGTVGVSMSF